MTASDADEDGTDGITYEIVNDGGKFEVTKSGEVKLSGGLDRETKDSYQIGLLVIDAGKLRAEQKTLSVTVGDINDNSPVCVKATYSGLVAEDDPKGTVIVENIRATDKDLGESGKVRATHRS